MTYTQPLVAVDVHLDAHRAFLEQHYAKRTVLLSKRGVRPEGRVILAQAASRDALHSVLAIDPFHHHGLEEYQVIEFIPGMAVPSLASLTEQA